MDALKTASLSSPAPARTAPPVKSPPPSRGPDVHRQSEIGEQTLGWLGEIRGGPPVIEQNPHLRDIMQDKMVGDATRPGLADNPEAAELKKEYRQAYQQTEDGRTWAQDLASQYGPGTHKLPNGEVIVVSEHPFDGSMNVSRREADGSSRRVNYSEDDPTKVQVFERDAEGNQTTWKREGTSVTVSREGEDNSDDMYTLGPLPGGGLTPTPPPMFTAPNAERGNPTRMHWEGDQLTVTEVNRDGSTDSRTSDTLTWDMNDKHTPGRDLRLRDWGRVGQS